ncbi:MAG: methyltransferase domain-containing protein [Paracoccaceae bacterium]
MGNSDIFQAIAMMDESTVNMIAERLEYRGSDEKFVAMRNRYFDEINWTDCRRILDIGCGTGVVTRAIAAHAPPEAEVTGSDFSEALIRIARKKAAAQSLSSINFVVADGHSTEDRPASYDLVVAHTLVSHVADPQKVLSECARLVKPGGTVAVFDGDYASIAFGAGDADENRTVAAAILKTIVANPTVMRELPSLMSECGLQIDGIFADVMVETGPSAFFTGMIDTYIPSVVKAGHLSEDFATKWGERQKAAMASGRFFGSCNFISYVATRPKVG